MRFSYSKKVVNRESYKISEVVFCDRYIMAGGKRFDVCASQKYYNAFKYLPYVPQTLKIIGGKPQYKDIFDAIDKNYAGVIGRESIVLGFAEQRMRVHTKRFEFYVEIEEDMTCMKTSPDKQPKYFTNNYIIGGNDLLKIPAIMYEICKNHLTGIDGCLSGIKGDEYFELFGASNIVDNKLSSLVNSMKKTNAHRLFQEKINESLNYNIINIDGDSQEMNIEIPVKERGQRSNGFLEKCRFKDQKQSIYINVKNGTLLYGNLTDGKSLIVIEVKKGLWHQVAYFLHEYFESNCRYKRSLLPLHILKALGAKSVHKVYKGIEDNTYMSGRWFAIRNVRNKYQNFFNTQAKELFPE